MKRILLITLLVFADSIRPALADDPPTADHAWERVLQLLQVTNMQPPTTPEDKALLGDRLADLARGADEFWQQFSDSPHVWEAKLIVLQTTLDLANLEGKQPNLRLIESHVHEITEANSAPENVRAEAAYLLFQLHAAAVAEARGTPKLAALDTEAAAFAQRYPQT